MKILTWLTQKNRWLVVIFGIIIIFLCFLTQCRGKCDKAAGTSDTITRSDTVWDTTVKITQVPKPFPVHDTIIIPPGEIDSLAVVMAYFTESEYNVILRDDSDCYAQYNFSVYMNYPTGGDFIYKNRRPTVINTTTVVNNVVQERKFKLFLGASIGGSATSFEVSPGVLIQYKSFLTGVQFGVIGKSVSIPIFYKLSFKKKGKK